MVTMLSSNPHCRVTKLIVILSWGTSTRGYKGLPGTGTKLPGTPPRDKLGGAGLGVEEVQGQGWRVQGGGGVRWEKVESR